MFERRLTEAEVSAVCNVLVTRLGGSYSGLLGIRLASMDSDEAFKWFVAAMLLGSPVRAASALAAYRALGSQGLLEPHQLATVDEGALVETLAACGITGYARRIGLGLRLGAESLIADYDADINRLHFFAEDASDLVRKLRQLGPKMSHRAVNLFLREMSGVWDKARPGLSAAGVAAACRLGIVGAGTSTGEAVDRLRAAWERTPHTARTYADLEVALVCLGEKFCEKRLCVSCPMDKLCASRAADSRDMVRPGVVSEGLTAKPFAAAGAMRGRVAGVEVDGAGDVRPCRNDATGINRQT